MYWSGRICQLIKTASYLSVPIVRAFQPAVKMTTNSGNDVGKLDVSKLGKNQLKSVATGELISMENLWKEKTSVIVFFRRWGCIFCRLWAKELSEIAPLLQKNNIRLIGVGVEDLGVEDFVAGKYFDGELFVDVDKQTYKALAYKRFSLFSILASLLSSEARAAISKGRSMKLGGDMRGDALQVGGLLVITAGGNDVVLNFKQERPAEHIPNDQILSVLGLTDKKFNNISPVERPESCTVNKE